MKDFSRHVQTQNARGEWVPSIPRPYYLFVGRVRCECGEKFRNEKIYDGHYALEHILGMYEVDPH